MRQAGRHPGAKAFMGPGLQVGIEGVGEGQPGVAPGKPNGHGAPDDGLGKGDPIEDRLRRLQVRHRENREIEKIRERGHEGFRAQAGLDLQHLHQRTSFAQRSLARRGQGFFQGGQQGALRRGVHCRLPARSKIGR